MYKSPAVFVFIRALDDLYRENKGCCEHAASGDLVWKPIIVNNKLAVTAFHSVLDKVDA